MKENYIWVLTSSKGEFIKACATREVAIREMKKWRENFVSTGIFAEVSKVDTVYYDHISFKVTERDGKVREMFARCKTLIK